MARPSPPGRVGRIAPALGVVGTASPLGALAWLGVPWGIIAIIVVLASTAACLNAVFPQNSRDRLEWWQALWAWRLQRAADRTSKSAGSLNEIEGGR